MCVCVHSPRGGLGRSSYGEALSSDTTAAAAAAVSRLLICTQTHTQKKKKKNQLDENTDRRCFSVVRMKLWNNVDMSIKMWNSFVVFK